MSNPSTSPPLSLPSSEPPSSVTWLTIIVPYRPSCSYALQSSQLSSLKYCIRLSPLVKTRWCCPWKDLNFSGSYMICLLLIFSTSDHWIHPVLTMGRLHWLSSFPKHTELFISMPSCMLFLQPKMLFFTFPPLLSCAFVKTRNYRFIHLFIAYLIRL